MPKETVYPLPNSDGTDADTRVEVGWSRDSYVQLATTKLQPEAARNVEWVDKETGKEGPSPTWDGWYISLDRWQINELIRHLRRARDQAFGRDE